MGTSVYDAKFHPARFIALCEKGYTIAKICGDFNIGKQTYYNWRKAHEEFDAAVEIGLVKVQAIEEDVLDQIVRGEISKGCVTAQIFKMKSRFRDDYADISYVKNDTTVTVTLSDDQLNKQIKHKFLLLSAKERQELLQSMPSLGTVIEGKSELVETQPMQALPIAGVIQDVGITPDEQCQG